MIRKAGLTVSANFAIVSGIRTKCVMASGSPGAFFVGHPRPPDHVRRYGKGWI